MKKHLGRLLAFTPFFAIVLGLLTIIAPVSAQEITRETITIDGVNHTLHHADSIPPSRVETVRAVMRNVIPRYTNLFGVANVEIDVAIIAAESVPGRLADARPNLDSDTPDCYVRVYDVAENRNLGSLRFTIAHEIAHCFQFVVRSNPREVLAGMDNREDFNGWWIEGSAEWLASRIYPAVGEPIAGTLRDFYTISSQNIFIYQYQQYWFFNFLAQRRGEGAVIDLIRRIPADRPGQLTYLEGLGTTVELFKAYGQAIMGRRLRHQPPLSRVVVDTFSISTLPGEQTLPTSTLSAQIYKVGLPTPRAGYGLLIRQVAGAEQGYRILTTGDREITTGGLKLCRTDLTNTLLVMVTRGHSATEDATNRVAISEVSCNIDPGCMTGEWTVYSTQGAPVDSPYMTLDPSYGEIKFSISADGAVRATVAGVQNLPNGWITIERATMTGQFEIIGEGEETAWGSISFPISFSQPITGNGTGRGGTADAQGITTFNDSMSGRVLLPSYTRVDCGNRTETADGVSYGYLNFWFDEATSQHMEMFR